MLTQTERDRTLRLKGNEELVRDLMTFSPKGALSPMFIISAITNATKEVESKKDNLLAQDELDRKEGRVTMISIPAWIEVSENIKERMDLFYDRKTILNQEEDSDD